MQFFLTTFYFACAATMISADTASRSHPQMTYGALNPADANDCLTRWVEDADGNEHFVFCNRRADLFIELGSMREDHPRYEKRKAVLLELLHSKANKAESN